jgi:AcrR family transcriptional regulator
VSDEHGRRGPGRPPVLETEERRRRVLAAAEEIFAGQGYAATNMDQIARRCKMSKQSVYGVFASKEALFAALVAESVPQPPPAVARTGTPTFEAELVALLEAIARRALSQRQVSMTRLVIEDSDAARKLRGSFYEKSVMRGREFLAEQIERLADEHGLALGDDFRQMSDILFGAVVGVALVHVLVGDDAAARWETVSARIRRLARLIALAGERDSTASDDGRQ